MSEPVYISSSPHITSEATTDKIMRDVIYSLIPACAVALYFFGLPALRILLLCTLGCMVFEAACNRLAGKPYNLD